MQFGEKVGDAYKCVRMSDSIIRIVCSGCVLHQKHGNEDWQSIASLPEFYAGNAAPLEYGD